MPFPYIQANTQGRLHPADQPSVSPLNRGFLYGDAVYEVWRSYHGVLFAWEEHWQRLLASAGALYLPVPWSAAEILAEIKKTVTAYRAATAFTGEVYVRLQVSRGTGAIGLDLALAGEPDFVLLVQPCPQLSERQRREGLVLSIAQELRRNHPATVNPAWKTGNYLNNLLCLREARARGADEVVIPNLAGELAECSVSNIAFIRDGQVVLPPLSAGMLAGITRAVLLTHVAPACGLAVVEETVRPEQLGEFQECFITASTKDVMPVRAIDTWTFQVGPNTQSERLKAGFAHYAATYAAAHPELQLG